MGIFSRFIEQRNNIDDSQDLADDTENPDMDDPDLHVPEDNKDFDVIKKAIKIALGADEHIRKRVYSFIRRLSNSLPAIHHLAAQLKHHDEDTTDSGEAEIEPEQQEVMPNASDKFSGQEGGDGGSGGGMGGGQ